MLKIPSPGDRTPPLVVPVQGLLAENLLLGPIPLKTNKKRRKKKSRNSESQAWDSTPDKLRGSGREEKRQMFWMLMGGVTLFALIVAGVLMAMLGGEKADSRASGSPVALKLDSGPSAPGPAAILQKSDATFLAEAEPLAKRFLEGIRIEDLLPLVRNPKLAEARMLRQYPDGKITASGMSGFNTLSEISRVGTSLSVRVRTRDYEEKALAFFETPEGFKINWESWVGWSEMPWGAFIAAKTTTAKMFRVILGPVEYYNIGFADDRKWKSYRLVSPDGKYSLYGYAEVGSLLNASLRLPPESTSLNLILSLKFPENATSSNQVIIEKRIAEGWVLENESSP